VPEPVRVKQVHVGAGAAELVEDATATELLDNIADEEMVSEGSAEELDELDDADVLLVTEEPMAEDVAEPDRSELEDVELDEELKVGDA